ncbi:hypothetical protein BV22DRAFT_844839 [Leucogyrophana mollusca]|uniref:Uncharacterized protein n=1 Tax=Leucogyrophana mollusca TaxID=85980 RepID=A0ACB8B1S7_9AGAM|nr:hypothetical protein BV22DRAFT_844839 [Leucogyrophana mollusca]
MRAPAPLCQSCHLISPVGAPRLVHPIHLIMLSAGCHASARGYYTPVGVWCLRCAPVVSATPITSGFPSTSSHRRLVLGREGSMVATNWVLLHLQGQPARFLQGVSYDAIGYGTCSVVEGAGLAAWWRVWGEREHSGTRTRTGKSEGTRWGLRAVTPHASLSFHPFIIQPCPGSGSVSGQLRRTSARAESRRKGAQRLRVAACPRSSVTEPNTHVVHIL